MLLPLILHVCVYGWANCRRRRFYRIEALPNLDYKIVKGNSLKGLPENAMKDYAIEVEVEKLKTKFFDETDEARKKN